MINERSDGVPIHLAEIILSIEFLVYLLKLNLFCRKTKDMRKRQIKEGFLFVV
jgi:competence protein ComGF